MAEEDIWTKAFKETAREKKRMEASDVDKPRSNEGKYDESKYNPKRKAMIQKARAQGLTSAADMEKAAEIKRAARRAAYAEAGKKGLKTGLKSIPGVGIAIELLDPTELGAAERMPDELKSELNQMEEYKKGGLVSRGQGKSYKIKKTKFY